MHVDIDILVYAVIAALILGRLWAVLGTRHDDEPRRAKPAADDASFAAPQISSRMQPVPLPPASLAGGLAQIKAIDPAFDEKQFLQIVRDIFSVVVGAYAAGKLNSVSEFLSPLLQSHFQISVDARTAAGQTAQSRVSRIKEAEVIGARAEDKQAFVTVKFVSDQENVLRDARGTIIGGHEGQTEEVTDIWTFARDTKTVDAKWVVVETRG